MPVPRGLPLQKVVNRLRCPQSYTLQIPDDGQSHHTMKISLNTENLPNSVGIIRDNKMRVICMERHMSREEWCLDGCDRSVPSAVLPCSDNRDKKTTTTRNGAKTDLIAQLDLELSG